jgi:hypothetical protein
MPKPRLDLTAAILAHLAANPTAADSAEGVARWWLGDRAGPVSVGEAQAALEGLAREGRIRRMQLADGNTLYCGSEAPPPPEQRKRRN